MEITRSKVFLMSLSCEQSGVLKIIDRKKNIFKLAQGEYIAPEKIENVYVHSGPVAQVFVHGDSLQVNVTSLQSVPPQHTALTYRSVVPLVLPGCCCRPWSWRPARFGQKPWMSGLHWRTLQKHSNVSILTFPLLSRRSVRWRVQSQISSKCDQWRLWP